MPPDSTATKARLLDAALSEFAEHGIAGARVDRIAEQAGANKRLLYVYYGNKEQLFGLPFTPDDLPGYAAALFDYLIAHPQLMRLGTWKLLERPEVVDAEVDAYRAKLETIGHTQRAGHLSSALDPVDLLILVLGLANAWFAASPALHSLAAQDPTSPERIAAHRAAIATAVRALTTAAVPQAAAATGAGRPKGPA
jgi:Tetracyclin repressor-like, C-terminal domain/Bacterial regulatory proteins, tetR family